MQKIKTFDEYHDLTMLYLNNSKNIANLSPQELTRLYLDTYKIIESTYQDSYNVPKVNIVERPI